jgi:5-methylcytosine-specific restriction endonuclease McrA
MERKPDLKSISDDDLLRRLVDLVGQSRRVEADVVAHIAEVDERRLYAREASPSLFAYCTEVLHLSEAEAYLRIAAARASREHPTLLTMLGDGRLHLSAIAKLAPHLTADNRERVLKRATHKSKRQIEELVAELAPRPDTPAVMRKLPVGRSKSEQPPALELRPDAVPGPGPRADAAPTRDHGLGLDAVGSGGPELRPDAVAQWRTPAPAKPASVEPLAPSRYKVQFTASAELRDKLERLRALMRSSVPDGDLGAIIEQAVTEKLERLESARFARTKAPRKSLAQTDTSPSSRDIPAAVRRAVYARDGGRCRFTDEQGRRCTARDRLEFHHRHPSGYGGDRSPENIRLMCRAHNQYLAEHDYGKRAMAKHRSSGGRVSERSAVYSP